MVLAILVALGVVLRLAPCFRDPGFSFAWDAQYHERLTRQVVESGRLALVDSLSNAPLGRRTASHLPVGMYFAGAWFHWILVALGHSDLTWNLGLMQAVVGALIALPVWLAALVLFRDRHAAAIAAVLAVFLPAHIARTPGFDLRYDGLGTLLGVTHSALVLAALTESRPWRRWLLSIGGALAFVAAMSVWRVSLLVLLPELAYAAIRYVPRGPESGARAVWFVMAVAGTIGLMPVGYLSEHGFLLSPWWLGVAGFGVMLMVPGFDRGRWPLRLVALAMVATLAMGLGRVESSSDYSGVASLLLTKLGLARGHAPDAALMMTVRELQGVGVWRFLVSGQFFSLLGAGFAASPMLFWWLAGRPPLRRVLAMESAPATFACLAATFCLSTLLLQRSCILLAPFLAVTLAGLLVRVHAFAAVKDSPRHRRARGSIHLRRWAGTLGGAVLGLGMVVAVANGIIVAVTGAMHIAPNERTAIEFLRTHARAHDVVMCDWDAGYEIQSRAGLATVTDGLLESAENRSRIVEFYSAMMDPRSERLVDMCRRYHARWLLLPTSSAIYAMAAVTGDPLADVLARHEAVPRGPLTDHLIVHLFEGDQRYAWLRRTLEVGGYTVFEIVGSSGETR